VALRIEEDLMSFANYGFPESHAWSFALIAYATAYLKAHHPTEFTMAILNAQPMGFYPIATLIHDAKRGGVKVIGPCLVQGTADCTVESGHRRPGAPDEPRLRIGWRFVRGMGDKGLEALTKARESGPFSDIGDVVRRAMLSRPDTIALARAGAFSFWESDRRRAAWEALRHVGDTLPFAPPRPSIHRPRILGKTETVFLDYFSTGMSLTGHPMEHLRSRLLKAGAISSRDLVSARHVERVLIAGLVVARQRPQSANGVMFVLMEDELGFINAIVRKEVQETHQEIVRHSLFLLVLGKIQRDGQVIQILAERLKPIRPTAALAFKSRDFR
jgi:error-prone DNA polymerase